MPHRKSLAAIWRKMPQRYRGESTMCLNCGRHFFPPRKFCPYCRRKSKIVPYTISGKGKVESYTIVHVAQEGFERGVPYVMAIIELEEGAKLTAQLCGVEQEDVYIGMPVEMSFRRISEDKDDGIIHYGYKFSPIAVRKK